jgi:hypothetical protein
MVLFRKTRLRKIRSIGLGQERENTVGQPEIWISNDRVDRVTCIGFDWISNDGVNRVTCIRFDWISSDGINRVTRIGLGRMRLT